MKLNENPTRFGIFFSGNRLNAAHVGYGIRGRSCEMFYYFTIGTVLGLSAGFAPGPLLALVITETLEHDIRSGIKVSLAPIITDLPIIIFTYYFVSRLSDFSHILGVVSLIGGCFVLYMGYESSLTKGGEINLQRSKPRSLVKGVLVNALSPHPYLFWLSVGAPIMAKALNVNMIAPLLFIGAFYLFLVGSKVLLAVFVGRSRSFLNGNAYLYTMRVLGAVLCVFAFALIVDGLVLLGMLEV